MCTLAVCDLEHTVFPFSRQIVYSSDIMAEKRITNLWPTYSKPRTKNLGDILLFKDDDTELLHGSSVSIRGVQSVFTILERDGGKENGSVLTRRTKGEGKEETSEALLRVTPGLKTE